MTRERWTTLLVVSAATAMGVAAAVAFLAAAVAWPLLGRQRSSG